jgi:putative membrane protein
VTVDRPAVGPSPAFDVGVWHRLHPLTPFARGWIAVAILWALLVNGGLREARIEIVGLTGLGLLLIAMLYGLLSWLFTRFRIADDALQVESGVLFRRSRSVPLARLQSIDVRRPIVARLLGLSDLRLEVAGGGSSEATLAYLSDARAQRLRAELLARAAGLRTETGAEAPEAPEQVVVEVPVGALAASILLRVWVVVGILLVLAVLGGGIVLGELGFLFGFLPLLLGVGSATIGEFVRHFGFTVAISPDGLRLRYGLLETRAQTVPPGRVQAIALVQPLLWRPFGWVRVDVTVAGSAGDPAQINSRVSAQLLPVAPRQTALYVAGLALPGANIDDVPLRGVPERAKRRAPLQWRRLGAGADDVVFASRTGRFVRRLSVVPHARTQSVRVTQGPWQRPLRLATMHIDTMPGPVSVAAPHRDVQEARQLAEEQVERARSARATDQSERWMRAAYARSTRPVGSTPGVEP